MEEIAPEISINLYTLAELIGVAVAALFLGMLVCFLFYRTQVQKHAAVLQKETDAAKAELTAISAAHKQEKAKITHLEDALKAAVEQAKAAEAANNPNEGALEQEIDRLETMLEDKEGALLSFKADYIQKQEELSEMRERLHKANLELSRLREALRSK